MTRIADPPTTTRWAPVVALALAMVVVTSDLTIASIALPDIGQHFSVSPADTAWVLLAYALPMAAVAIPAGQWADRADVRRVFLLSMAGVAVSSLVAGLATGFWMLLAARLFQGVAAALTMAVYMPIVASSVHTGQRGRAIGYVITIMTVGGLIGSPLGGLVTGTWGWRSVFLLKLPVVVAAVWVAWRSLGGDGRGLPVPSARLWRGAAVMGGAMVALLSGVERLAESTATGAVLLAISVALFAAWLRLRDSRPLVGVLRGRVMGLTLLSLFLASMLVGLVSFLLPYFVTERMGAGPEGLGLALLVFSGTIAPVSPVAGWLADRFGPHTVALAGAVVTLAGLVGLLTLDGDAGLPDLMWRMAILGVGGGLFNGPVNTGLMAATPPDMIGTAGGLFATVRTMASTVAPAVTALAWTTAGGGTAGFRAGVVVLAVGQAVSLLLLVAGRPRRGKAASGPA
ncbi:DHA2 family multidrug resistance protein-like MFS transporter [Stackebrandtia albiflava]|uniref:DHA2 family multidrug resistance protein-like MFS transporter n=1 Tax=Stackebrandtia albiflava TaxID=406432 RepID=A0A562URQ9_9ACTN|nr:MFS transporter [Stackebrandtia albiflava]TWJ08300.1 DHA2 family multidrug resistance protein-like MFS transporter [Stackebrandtia albiflava]